MAHWAAKLLYQGCLFVVCRDTTPQTIAASLQEKCPVAHSPAADYSADIVFQFWPQLMGMTRAVSQADPLLDELKIIAREWPLSSVGIAEVGAVEIQSFFGHPALRQLYVDRILAHEDLARLGSPEVDNAVREAFGAFPELCPRIAELLNKNVSAKSNEQHP